ncbi:MAG: hypothetical protein IKE94_12780 [Aeriscardovia sp.]|nr:hypothetical protein [Aeriscardovia sp.]
MELEALSKEEGLPQVRFIETAVREYLSQLKGGHKYRITGVNEITGVRQFVSAIFNDLDTAQDQLSDFRKYYRNTFALYSRLQVERVTI